MDIEQAIETIYTGLVSEESVPVKLRAFRELDREMLGQVQEALSFAIEYYGAAEPPVRCGESHLSGLTEPLRSL